MFVSPVVRGRGLLGNQSCGTPKSPRLFVSFTQAASHANIGVFPVEIAQFSKSGTTLQNALSA